MKKIELRYGICTLALCGIMSMGSVMEARADYETPEGPAFSQGDYVASIEKGNHSVYVSMDSDEVLGEASEGEAYQILDAEGDGWMEIQVGEKTGYISVEEEGIAIMNQDEMAQNNVMLNTKIPGTSFSEVKRQELVSFALQFLGGRYRAAGNDPHTGVDCSGFTKYVMLHGAGVTIERSSAAQSQQGVDVSADQMRPGDLVFYGSGGRVNHVAMYIGNGQVVHASTYETGIKLSPWNYRAPVRIKNVLGD